MENENLESQHSQTGFELDQALRVLIKTGGSDLHLTLDAPPKIRISGSLKTIGAVKFTEDVLKKTLYSILEPEKVLQFKKDMELDFAYEIDDGLRFRVNYFVQKGVPGAVFRHISSDIKSLEQLKMPTEVASFAEMPRGLVLVTGPTGSGKSTTLAAIVDLVNRNRECHIMTVEDPIEYIHNHKKALINQRQVGLDTANFATALKHVLRQDPDVILIGELRDLETISIALTAAETGHLVFATLHTQDTAQSIDRIIDVFPPDQQAQVRTQLASTLRGVVCQALLPKININQGRVVATEVMFVNPAIANLIREQKTYQIYSTLQTGRKEGMHSMDQSLAELINKKIISYEAALEAVHEKKTLDILVDPSLRMGSDDIDNKAWSDMSKVNYDQYRKA